MALLIHHMQGSCAPCSLWPLPWTNCVKVKPFVAFTLFGRTVGCNSMKRSFHLSIGNQPLLSSLQRKPFKISSFKGNTKSGESEDRVEDSRPSSASVKLSYVPQDREETISVSPDICGSPDIQKLFKKWLMMLRVQTLSETTNGIFRETQPQSQVPRSQCRSERWKTGKLLNAALGFFLQLDAAIKFPLMIFVPWYLAINIVYGTKVAKELTPLWVLGPLIISLYIRLIKGLHDLYVLTIKKSVSLVRATPTFCVKIYSYVAGGHLTAELGARFWQPLIDAKNLDYKELSKQKWKELEERIVERYLDFVESIWPHYCRTIRFLKKANLI